MKLKRSAIIFAALFTTAMVVPALAHHSASAAFNLDQKVEIKGKIIQFLLRNPHPYLHVMAPDENGKMQRWACEWGPGIAALARSGISAGSLKPGDEVIIGGHPGRVASDHRIGMTKLVRPSDGFSWSSLFTE